MKAQQAAINEEKKKIEKAKKEKLMEQAKEKAELAKIEKDNAERKAKAEALAKQQAEAQAKALKEAKAQEALVEKAKKEAESLAEKAAEQDFKQSLKKHHKHHKKEKFINDHYDGKHSDGLENGKKSNIASYDNDHYDDLAAKHKGGNDVAEAQPKLTKAQIDGKAAMEEPLAPKKEAAKPEALVEKSSKHHKKEKFINDHYDGKHSDGLENGKKSNIASYDNDHYDDLAAKHKEGNEGAVIVPKLTEAQKEKKNAKLAQDIANPKKEEKKPEAEAPKEEAKAEGEAPQAAAQISKKHKKHKHHHKKEKNYADADEKMED